MSRGFDAFRRQHAVLHVSAIMHILPGLRGTYIWGGGGGGYVFSGYCSRQQIAIKNEALIFGGVLFYGIV